MPDAGPKGTGVGIASEYRGALDDYVAHWSSCSRAGASTACVSSSTVERAAFRAAPLALHTLGASVEVLHAAPSGSNINDACRSTHPEELQAAVVAAGAQIGLAFDGDADRGIAVDEQGELTTAIRSSRSRPSTSTTGGCSAATPS